MSMCLGLGRAAVYSHAWQKELGGLLSGRFYNYINGIGYSEGFSKLDKLSTKCDYNMC